MTDLLVVSLRQSSEPQNTVWPFSEGAEMLPELLHTVTNWLFQHTFPSDRDLLYFGQEAFPLVQQWLVTYAEDRKQANCAADKGSSFLIHPIGLGYGKMLGTPLLICKTK